jgi:hypothetical protein
MFVSQRCTLAHACQRGSGQIDEADRPEAVPFIDVA